MTAKYTPGPWKLIEVGDRGNLCPADECNNSLLTVVRERGVGFGFAAVYSDADARLIAAAPDLLEALEALVAEQHGPPLLGPPLLGRHERAWREAMAKAEAAIAKARGVATSSAGGHPIRGGTDA